MWRPHRELANGRTPYGSVNHHRIVAGFAPIPEGEREPVIEDMSWSPFMAAHLPEVGEGGSEWLPPGCRHWQRTPWDPDGVGYVVLWTNER